MKDPLQQKSTPYEVLGIPINADKKAIDTAFKKSIALGRNIKEATEARNTLSRPLDRAFMDIFLYNEFFVNQLVPRLGEDSSQLLYRRVEIAQAWSNIQKTLFPHFSSTHSLAVLWYWWSLYCEEEQWALTTRTPFKKQENLSQNSSLAHLWSNTISNWIFLINAEEFLIEWIKSKAYTDVRFDNNDIKTIHQRLESHFVNIFHSFNEKYRNNGDPASAKRYQDYEFQFSTEMKTARHLLKERLQLTKGNKKFTISCGRLMLEQIGLLGAIQRQIEELVKLYPQNPVLKDLLTSLSPFVEIVVLIDNKKFDEAIQTINALPPDKRNEKEVLRFLAKGYLEKGKQHFGLNQFENALSCWNEALRVGELRDEITQTVISNCKTKAAALQRSDPDTAIAILELGLEVINDVTLKETLSVIYCERGITRIVEAQKRMKPAAKNNGDLKIDKKSLKLEIEKGVGELRKAAQYNPSNTRAREQLEISEDFLSGFDFADVYEDMNAKQWQRAINKLESTLKLEPQNSKAKELLGICYDNWAVEELQRTQDLDNAKNILRKGLQKDPGNKRLIEDLQQIDKMSAGQLNGQGVELANQASDLLNRGQITRAGELLREAEALLSQAASKDPTNSTISNNLAQARQLLDMLERSYARPTYDYSTQRRRPAPTRSRTFPQWVGDNIGWLWWFFFLTLWWLCEKGGK